VAYSITSSFFVGSCSGIGMQRPCGGDTFVTTAFLRWRISGQAGEGGGEQGGINKANGIEGSPCAGIDRGSWPPAAPWRSLMARTAVPLQAFCRHAEIWLRDQWGRPGRRVRVGIAHGWWLGTAIGSARFCCHGVHHAWGAGDERELVA